MMPIISSPLVGHPPSPSRLSSLPAPLAPTPCGLRINKVHGCFDIPRHSRLKSLQPFLAEKAHHSTGSGWRWSLNISSSASLHLEKAALVRKRGKIGGGGREKTKKVIIRCSLGGVCGVGQVILDNPFHTCSCEDTPHSVRSALADQQGSGTLPAPQLTEKA